MKLYKIETGIKVPPVAHPGSGGETSAIVATMQKLRKTESFLVKGTEALKASKAMRDLMTRERKSEGKREFVSRKLGVDVRIWRTK